MFSFTFSDNFNCTSAENIQNAYEIQSWVTDILNSTGAEKVDIVSHSMGGISSRDYIKFLDGIDKVDDFVSLGTPHRKSVCADESRPLLTYQLNEGDETPRGVFNNTVGSRFDEIIDVIFNGTHVPGNITYTSIFSSDDSTVPANLSTLEGAVNILVSGFSHTELNDGGIYHVIEEAVRTQFVPPVVTTTETSTTVSSVTSDESQTSNPQTTSLILIEIPILVGFTLFILIRRKFTN